MADAMDSKSISCDGSRGSSPRPGTNVIAPGGTGEVELARALLPVLLHDLNNHTQYLTALNALVAQNSPAVEGEESPGGGEALAQTAREIEELGWILGLCAGGFGSDLLHERTERRGLVPLVALVRKALRREGRDIERADRELPDLPTKLGWRGAWRVGELLFACGRAGASPLAWDLRADGVGLELVCHVDPSALPPYIASAGCVDSAANSVRFRIEAGTRA